ncbi:MAG: hypothetical protein LBI02_04340, partial [Opitutaceae bacterium]|nr:hypothetical protein [Opitutaceae bacterium]
KSTDAETAPRTPAPAPAAAAGSARRDDHAPDERPRTPAPGGGAAADIPAASVPAANISSADILSTGVSAAGIPADKIIFLPPPGPARRRLVRRLRNEFPDTHILLENSAQADREARLINAPQRFGLCTPGRRRPHLTHTWSPPPGDGPGDHPAPSQVRLWEQWWESLGLPREPDDARLT